MPKPLKPRDLFDAKEAEKPEDKLVRLVAELEQKSGVEPTEDLDVLRMAILTTMGKTTVALTDEDLARIQALGYPEDRTMRELYDDAVQNGEIETAE